MFSPFNDYESHLQVFLLQIKDEWKYVAMVVDRLLLWIYTVGCIIGAMVLLLNAPSLFDNKTPLEANYKTEANIEEAFAKDKVAL